MDIFIYSYCAVALIIAAVATSMIIKDRKKPKTWSHLLEDDSNRKKGLPIPLRVILFAAFWPLAIAGVVVYVLLGLDQRAAKSPAFDEQLYAKLSKKWAKRATKALRGESRDKDGIASLREDLHSVIHDELHQYRLDAFLEAVDECTEDSHFDGIYERILAANNDEDARNYEELIRNKPPNVHYCPSIRTYSDWSVVTTRRFRKSISRLDQKTKDRITHAIQQISFNPKQPEGNTVKPLKHDLKDCWRYRIGGNRLVYRPDDENRKIVLISFANRSEVYS